MIAAGLNCAHSTAIRLVQNGQNEVAERATELEGEKIKVRRIDSSLNVRVCGRI